MDSDLGKLFIGGISWETTDEKLREHFGRYGPVLETAVMRDKATQRPRGFGFVVFADPAILDTVLADQHNIDGRTVEAKRALSREEQQTSARSGNPGPGRTFGGSGGGNTRTKKIFVGGLPATTTDEGLRNFFGNYGTIDDVVVMYDSSTQRPRGFGFVTFLSEDSVDKVLAVNNFHELEGKMVEVKRALPKDMNSTNASGRSSGTAGTHQSYGGSSGNTSSYEGRVGANGYAQPTGGGYPPYGSSGYGAPGGYGYGPANNGLDYGGYGVGGGYGYPSAAPTSGYATNVPPGPQRTPWSNQPSTGFGSTGYGGSGMGVPPAGQSSGAAPGYGNQGYGYGQYADGSYGSQAGYATGGRGDAGEQGGAAAYSAGGGYAGANGNPGNLAPWRSNPAAGGGYGAGQASGPPGGPTSYGGSGYPV